MKRNTHLLPALLGATAMVFAAGTALAGTYNANNPKNATASATAQKKFDALDTNNDGSISKSEAAASTRLSKEFSTLDANKDNKLSMTEFMSASDLASIKVDHAKTKTKGY